MGCETLVIHVFLGRENLFYTNVLLLVKEILHLHGHVILQLQINLSIYNVRFITMVAVGT